MNDIVRYALSFEFITEAYIPQIVNLLGILFIGIVALVFSAVFYHFLEKTIFEIPIVLLIVVGSICWVLLALLFAIMLIGLPAILVIISLKVYLTSLLPDAPVLVICLTALITAAILGSLIEFINNKK